jgi:putative resolvase
MFLGHPVGTLRDVNIAEWARRQGISERTARRRFHAGTLGVPARQLDTKRIVVDVPEGQCQGACLVDIHLSCLVDVVLAELGRRGYSLDSAATVRHHEG